MLVILSTHPVQYQVPSLEMAAYHFGICLITARNGATASRRPARDCSVCRPYSPDFNPIENAFAKLKALLRARPPSATLRPYDI